MCEQKNNNNNNKKCLRFFPKRKNLQIRPIMSSSDVAEDEELSEPEFKEHADITGISTSWFSPVFLTVYRGVAVVIKKKFLRY